MSAAALSVGEIIAASLTSAFSEPIAEFQARIEALTSIIQSAFDPKGTYAALNVISNNERFINNSKANLEEIEKRKPGSGTKKKYLPGVFGDAGSGDLSQDEYESRKARIQKEIDKAKNNIAVAQKQFGASDKSAFASIEERKAAILADGGPKTGFGEGKTAEERIAAAIKRVNLAAKSALPKTTAAVQSAISPMQGPPVAPASIPKLPPAFARSSMMQMGGVGRPAPVSSDPFIGPPLPHGFAVPKFDQLQRSSSAFDRLQSSPRGGSILSEPSVSSPGSPRATLRTREKATKILGAEATKRKRMEEEKNKGGEKQGESVDKIAAILEGWK